MKTTKSTRSQIVKFIIIAIAGLFFVVSVGIFFVVSLPWTILGVGVLLLPNPPRPAITHGEFPFWVEYEIDGERFVVEDVFIAEFDGFGRNLGQGAYRRWNGWLKGSGSDAVLLLVDGEKRIYATVGSAEFYMNDERWPRERPLIPRLIITLPNEQGGIRTSSSEELFEPYNIRLVDWQLSEPIVNSFVGTTP